MIGGINTMGEVITSIGWLLFGLVTIPAIVMLLIILVIRKYS